MRRHETRSDRSSLKELPWDKVSLLGLNADSIANMQRYRVYLGFLLWKF